MCCSTTKKIKNIGFYTSKYTILSDSNCKITCISLILKASHIVHRYKPLKLLFFICHQKAALERDLSSLAFACLCLESKQQISAAGLRALFSPVKIKETGIMTAFAVYVCRWRRSEADWGYMCEACSGSSQNCSFFVLCGERRRSSLVFGSTEPVVKMFGITLAFCPSQESDIFLKLLLLMLYFISFFFSSLLLDNSYIKKRLWESDIYWLFCHHVLIKTIFHFIIQCQEWCLLKHGVK